MSSSMALNVNANLAKRLVRNLAIGYGTIGLLWVVGYVVFYMTYDYRLFRLGELLGY